MKYQTLKMAAAIARRSGDMPVVSVRNRTIETKKRKSKHVDAWKKEARLYA